MKQLLITATLLVAVFYLKAQVPASTAIVDVNAEIERLKVSIRELQEDKLQSEKIKYHRNYQLLLYGIEIIKEIQLGTVEIAGARSQNILYKKIMDINNPSSDALGFQLIDVIDKVLDDNLSALPMVSNEKKRLKNQAAGLLEGLKNSFPPLQIIGSTIGMVSSFTSFNTRVEKLGRRADTMIVEATNPISKEVIGKFNSQLTPYIEFYNQLNKINTAYENALYSHVITYKDFIEEVNGLKTYLETSLNMNESIGEQINALFDLANSSKQDFDFAKINDNEKIRNIAGPCMNVYNLVERYKKFTSDFVAIQQDFYKDNIALLETRARKLPFKDDSKISALVTDLNNIQKGNPQEHIAGFDEAYKQKVQSITTKLYALNRTRF